MLSENGVKAVSELSQLESSRCDDKVQHNASGEDEVQPGTPPPPRTPLRSNTKDLINARFHFYLSFRAPLILQITFLCFSPNQ